jgi:hypothetical protein
MVNDSAIPIVGQPATQEQPLVEVCRSFSYKLNLQNHGGLPYESADFFASRKISAKAEDVPWVSQQIFEECVAEVRASIAAFIEDMRAKAGARAANQRRSA